jgi:hypothetical protein
MRTLHQDLAAGFHYKMRWSRKKGSTRTQT